LKNNKDFLIFEAFAIKSETMNLNICVIEMAEHQRVQIIACFMIFQFENLFSEK
jgi:hypothetical protein